MDQLDVVVEMSLVLQWVGSKILDLDHQRNEEQATLSKADKDCE